MSELVRLRPAQEDDLAVIESVTGDPEATGEFSWFGRAARGGGAGR
ncbi:MAG: hypothetical protein ACRDPO_06065 [Streptosporangiaceae bacterium]